MLLFADAFIQHLLLFRLCWIRGTLGGGKTLLSVALADYLLKLGLVDGVVANLPTDLPSSIGRDDGLLKRRAIIFDEAWTTVDARDSLVNSWLKWLVGFGAEFLNVFCTGHNGGINSAVLEAVCRIEIYWVCKNHYRAEIENFSKEIAIRTRFSSEPIFV